MTERRDSRGRHDVQEFIAFCPECKTVETVFFKRNVLEPTRRFRQGYDWRIYHDCNDCIQVPCRLFSTEHILGSGRASVRVIRQKLKEIGRAEKEQLKRRQEAKGAKLVSTPQPLKPSKK